MATPRSLPERPNLRHLKDQAKDLLKAGGAESLTNAQFKVARDYGFDSWPKLKVHVELLQESGQLKQAIDAEDLPRVIAMMTKNPALHKAPLGYNQNGPLTWVAECRGVQGPPSQTRLDMARWMIAHGSDIHQGGDGPLMRAAMNDNRIAMMELLVAHGADVNAVWNGYYPIICAPCECLAPAVLNWLLAHGANPKVESSRYGTPVSMVIGTYGRGAHGRHTCLEIFTQHGFPLPDTPCMAFHRGRIDLLEGHLQRDPGLLSRHFTEVEVFPLPNWVSGRVTACLSRRLPAPRCCTWPSSTMSWRLPPGCLQRARTSMPALRPMRTASAVTPRSFTLWCRWVRATMPRRVCCCSTARTRTHAPPSASNCATWTRRKRKRHSNFTM